jgi:NADPH:quinone reductase
MKAAVVRQYSDSPLEICDIPVPEPEAGEILVKIHTAGVVLGETIIARGKYQIKPELPFVAGTECAGTVIKLGPEVDQFEVGDHIAAIGFKRDPRKAREIIGSLAQYQAIPVSNALRVPRNIPLEQAALIRSNNETAYFALYKCNLKPGETLLVYGAAGGVGFAAVTIGKMLGARVIASCSTENKRRIAREAGADFTLDSNAEDWRQQVDELTEGRGLDVVFDPVGGDFTERGFRALGWNGRLVVIGFATGTIPRIPTNLALLKGISLIGANILQADKYEPDIVRQQREQLMQWFSEGRLKLPPIARRFGLDQAQQAHDLVAGGEVEGRVVVTIS